MMRDDATEAQVRAASPRASTWLAANAGSGKTRVLTDRVARLLLEGAQPQRILCLTYTKAAAAEMQNRLFLRLGAWAMLPDQKLRKQLADLGQEARLADTELRRARTLFARAIETPGGLKIQTIHSFCASILRRFPLEAQVSPGFAEMEDRAGALMRADIVRAMANTPQAAPAVRDLAGYLADQGFDKITASIIAQRDAFEPPLHPNDIDTLLGLPGGCTMETVYQRVFLGTELALIAQLLPVLQAGSKNDVSAAEKLAQITGPNGAALDILENVLLLGANAKEPFTAKIGSFPTKSTQAALGALQNQLEDLMRRVEDARDMRLAVQAAQRSKALHQFAAAFLPRYEARKQQLGWLDFDDLIRKARDLLTDPSVAEWVLYRLDGGIDHILVDEAQDTSPTQWKVIELLAQEFTAGAGARADAPRTIFVVGDKKQSIYSFQGADPRAFDTMKDQFSQRLQATGQPLVSSSLEYSFRSAEAILRLVDEVFARRHNSGFPADNRHRAFKGEMPGRVDLWPAISPTKNEQSGDWFDPVDQVSQDHHTKQMAHRVASQIKQMIDSRTAIPKEIDNSGTYEMHPVQAGDFLILVQRRSDLFGEIIQACKAIGLPIAGADRLKLGAELAVRDLAGLMSFLAVPEDCLSLAISLKSPLFGWDEQALFDLAHKRQEKYLWQALRARRGDFGATLAVLDDLRAKADFLRPFDLIERILTRHNGRKNLLARLGPEAEDGINAFLAQALAYERTAVPSLFGFLQWMETDDLEIKRQMDAAGQRIRVMTVHGAKGLEAPIVILPDTAQRNVNLREAFLVENGHALWNMPGAALPRALAEARQAHLMAEQAERDRLLYVALTRAEKWLIVGAAGELGQDGESWYHKTAAAMQHCNAAPHSFGFGQGLRLETGNWSATAVPPSHTARAQPVALPALFQQPAPPCEVAQKTLSPSTDLGGAKALPGDSGLDEESALRRGRQIHLLLEHLAPLPADLRHETAQALLASGPDAADAAELPSLLAEITRLLDAPSLAHVFGNAALAEVSITAPLDGGRRLHGTIDRLIVSDSGILAVDFKTNATVPHTAQSIPQGLVRQMAAYAHALAQVYPTQPISCAILWTTTAQLMPLPADMLADALADILAQDGA
ncbi:MAG: double-strand break repair helicase AddA [Rhodobacteraceae bacterium]|nr:double-strand break repair helicase AddA [Paracoccaceae bacterium]